MSNASKHIIIGLSGGVDSAVAAYLLKEAGYRVSAIFMKNWEDEPNAHCPSAQDFADAEAVAEQLDIPLRLVNFANEYWERVFSFFLDEYRLGRTPNPDILCNSEIKFRAFLDYAKQQGADAIATGHYARCSMTTSQPLLLKGKDTEKDQSYFLHALSASQLAYSLFPIGELTKPAVRLLAKKIGLKNHAKKDSTGICFIGERKFKTFLNEYLPAQPGLIRNLNGVILGEHEGLMFYTIGQRQGLKIGGQAGGTEAPWYVVRKDLKENTLYVAQGDHSALYSQTLTLTTPHWIHSPPSFPASLSAKIRYRQADQPCTIEKLETLYRVTFKEAQRAITPGQSIVFYDGDVCLGGGVIC